MPTVNSGTSSLVRASRPRNVARAGLGNGRGAATQPWAPAIRPATDHGGAGVSSRRPPRFNHEGSNAVVHAEPHLSELSSARRARLELPQLLNVLRGEMSVVGPRPERPAMVERFTRVVPGYNERWAVLPGITGLAQVLHVYDQSIKTVKQELRYDRCYIGRRGSFADGKEALSKS